MLKTSSLFLVVLLTLLAFASPSFAGLNSWTAAGPETAIIMSCAINPSDSSQLYSGTVGGKIFKSSDGGSNWALAAGLPEYAVNAIVLDQAHNGTAYAAGSATVYKTTDAGATWAAVGAGQISTSITGMAISNGPNPTLYVTTSSAGVYQSTSGGTTWTAISSGLPNYPYLKNLTVNSSGGLFATASGQLYRRLPGDTSWTLLSTGMSASESISTFAMDPLQQATLYAVTSSNVVYKTTNNGNSWSPVTPQWPVSDVEYISVSPLSSNTIFCFSLYGGFSSSNDGGVTWTVTSNNGLPSADYFAYAVDPNNPQVQFAGGNGDLYRTTSGGATWSKVMKGLVAPPVSAMGFVHGTATDILVGTGSGDAMYRSSDAGATWTSSASGLPGFISVSAIAVRPGSEQIVYAGYNDLGGISRSSDGGNSWSPVYTNLPSANNSVNNVAIAPSEPTKMYLSCYGPQSVFRSGNGGDSWIAVGGSGLPANATPNSIAVDSLNSSVVYAGVSGKVYKSTDSGDSWTALSATGLPSGSGTTVFVEPVTGNLIATVSGYAVSNGSLSVTFSPYRLVNGTWSPLTSNFVGTSGIFADPLSAGHYYIGAGPDLYRSSDAGATWQKLSYPGLSGSIASLAVHPNNAADIFAVTSDSGLYRLTEVAPPSISVPGAPTAVSASRGNARAEVSFTPPASNGGGAITSYQVTSSPGEITAVGSGSPITVTGLANGTSYSFVVTATNSAGPGAASSASASVTPSTQKPGDCNNDGNVSIDEVQSAIDMLLGAKAVTDCVDTDGSATVSYAEVQKVINAFLGL